MVESIFLIFVLFQNLIGQVLPSFFSYWDELLSLLLGCLFLFRTKGKIIKDDFTYLAYVLIIIVIGVLGNIQFGYQTSFSAIVRDIVGFMKFPLVFISLYRLNISKRIAEKTIEFIPFIRLYSYTVFAFGIVSLFLNIGMTQEEIRGTIHPYMFLYSHPTYLTTGLICLLCIMNAADEAGIKEDIVFLGSVALAMRTKGFAFIAVYVFLKYGARWARKLQFLYWPVIAIIVFFVTKSKLQMYASFSNSPRESLYVGSIKLLRDCFPIGSGFASFASHISGRYLSSVYSFIHIAGLYDINGEISVDIGDAGLPYYLGQFGFLGTLFIVLLIVKMIKMSIQELNGNAKLPMIFLWALVVISIPSEAILVNNGFEIAFVMVIVHRLLIESVLNYKRIE